MKHISGVINLYFLLFTDTFSDFRLNESESTHKNKSTNKLNGQSKDKNDDDSQNWGKDFEGYR